MCLCVCVSRNNALIHSAHKHTRDRDILMAVEAPWPGCNRSHICVNTTDEEDVPGPVLKKAFGEEDEQTTAVLIRTSSPAGRTKQRRFEEPRWPQRRRPRAEHTHTQTGQRTRRDARGHDRWEVEHVFRIIHLI